MDDSSNIEVKVDSRRKEFKKTFDDVTRRREDAAFQIRKNQREAHLAKKRSQATEAPTTIGGSSSGEALVDLSELPQLCQALWANDKDLAFQATRRIRRLLSVEEHPPIQRVIDVGALPAFVRLLQQDDRPDLQFEAAWAVTNIASGTNEQTAAVVNSGALPVLIRLLQSPKVDVREQCIWAIGNIAGDSHQFREMVLRSGAFESILKELKQFDQPATKLSMIRYSTWALSNLCRGKAEIDYELVSPALPVLRGLLYATDIEILADACWCISYLSDVNGNNSTVYLDGICQSGVCPRLVELLSNTSFLVQTPALRAVGNIVTGNDRQTQIILSFGVLPRLKTLLKSSRRTLKKEACWAISNITAGNRNQIEEVIAAGIIQDLVDIMANDEFEVKREAAWAISNASSGGNVRQVAYLVECGCLAPLANLLDVQDQKLVSIALEAIENILKTGAQVQKQEGLPEHPYVTALEEAGAFPKLEKLQYLPVSSRLQQTCVRIMTQYLEVVEDETGDPQMGPFG